MGGRESHGSSSRIIGAITAAARITKPILPTYGRAKALARQFSTTEPATVLVGVESTEREWARDAARGQEYIVPLLNDYSASWALLRQWAGYDAAVAQREAEIQRLERLVWDAVYALQKAGLDSEAARLR